MDEYVEKIIQLDINQEEYDRIASQYLFEGKEPSLDSIKKQLSEIL